MWLLVFSVAVLACLPSVFSALPYGEPVAYGFYKPVNTTANLTAHYQQRNTTVYQKPSSLYTQIPSAPVYQPAPAYNPAPPAYEPVLPAYQPPPVHHPPAYEHTAKNKNAPSSNRTHAHDFIIGTREAGDELLTQMSIFKEKTFFGVARKEVTFPSDKYKKVRITRIEAYDPNTKGEGGTAKLVEGGPGYKFVSMKFKAQSGYPLNFILEIYGKRM